MPCEQVTSSVIIFYRSSSKRSSAKKPNCEDKSMNCMVAMTWYLWIFLWNFNHISIDILEKQNMPSTEAWKTWQTVGG